MGIAVSQPLDTVRVKMQQQPSTGFQRNAAQMLGVLVKKEGPLSVFKGLSFPLAFTALQVSRACMPAQHVLLWMHETHRQSTVCSCVRYVHMGQD